LIRLSELSLNSDRIQCNLPTAPLTRRSSGWPISNDRSAEGEHTIW